MNEHDKLWAEAMVLDFMTGGGRPVSTHPLPRYAAEQAAADWIDGHDLTQRKINRGMPVYKLAEQTSP